MNILCWLIVVLRSVYMITWYAILPERKTICCVMLDMRHREENLLDMKLFWTPRSPRRIWPHYSTRCSTWRAGVWQPNGCSTYGSTHEAIMLRLLRAGMSMEAIAAELHMSVKSLYRKRTALSERLGRRTSTRRVCLSLEINCWALTRTRKTRNSTLNHCCWCFGVLWQK